MGLGLKCRPYVFFSVHFPAPKKLKRNCQGLGVSFTKLPDSVHGSRSDSAPALLLCGGYSSFDVIFDADPDGLSHLPLIKVLWCLSVCLFVCLSDGKVSDGKGIKNFLIPGAAAGGRR